MYMHVHIRVHTWCACPGCWGSLSWPILSCRPIKGKQNPSYPSSGPCSKSDSPSPVAAAWGAESQVRCPRVWTYAPITLFLQPWEIPIQLPRTCVGNCPHLGYSPHCREDSPSAASCERRALASVSHGADPLRSHAIEATWFNKPEPPPGSP